MPTSTSPGPQRQPQYLPHDLSHDPATRMHNAPSSSVHVRRGSPHIPSAQAAYVENAEMDGRQGSSTVTRKLVGSRDRSANGIRENGIPQRSDWPLASPSSRLPQREHSRTASAPMPTISLQGSAPDDTSSLAEAIENYDASQPAQIEQLQYHHNFEPPRRRPVPSPSPDIYHNRASSATPDSMTATSRHRAGPLPQRPIVESRSDSYSRPASAMTLGSELHSRGRSFSPAEMRSETSLSPARRAAGLSPSRSPDIRASTIDLLNIPYSQQMAHHNLAQDNAQLRESVGNNASLLNTRKTLEMYRANVKKTNDTSIQYEFAIFMVSAAQEEAVVAADTTERQRDASPIRDADDKEDLLTEAKQILQKLADRSHVYSQYYLADGYFSGLFNKGKEDHEHAFPLFVSAGKHGHAEAAYRAALCYEYAWGCRKDYAKAVQFYRMAATKNHPGASTRLGMACLHGEMGLHGKYREGVKWLKRATDVADQQHNQAPFELGLMHVHGYGDDIFKDESYAAQLFTKAAELGHPEASLRMGEAYEHGLLTCPKDPALSIHFYTGAATAGIPKAMMALCAWYMVGAEPVLEKDEAEAYEWARRSADSGYVKAEYAVGYFTEMGIGCRRDPLEANVWYVRAADHGEEHAKQRLAIIRAAETGDAQPTNTSKSGKGVKTKKSWILGRKSG